MSERGQNLPFLGRTRKWYRYQKRVVLVPIGKGKVVPVPIKVVSVPITRKWSVLVPGTSTRVLVPGTGTHSQ